MHVATVLIVVMYAITIGVAYSSCVAEVQDQFSSGWAPTEIVTTTPACTGCDIATDNDCACDPDPVNAGPGQPGTASGGPCEAIGALTTCAGLDIANWDTIDNFISTNVPGLSTNAQVTQGLTNMNPPGYYDTSLSSTGFYAVKLSTNNGDDDMMGFVFGYEPMTVHRCAASRIEFTWYGRCCCDYTYSTGPQTCSPTNPSCCSAGTGSNPGAKIALVVGSPGDACYSSTTLGTASGGGWERAKEYNFHIELTTRILRIYRSIPADSVPPTLIFNYAIPPSSPLDLSGTFAWVTLSQPGVQWGPLEIAGEMGFGTEGCSSHVPFVELSIATDCTSSSEVEMEVSWDGGAFVTYPLDSVYFTTSGARFEEVTILNPSLTEGDHTAEVRVREVGASIWTSKLIDTVIVYPGISVVVNPVSVTGFPILCPTSPNEYLIPFCDVNVGSFMAVGSGGNAVGDPLNYGYYWSSDGGGILTGDGTDTISSLGVDTYELSIDDAYSCTASSDRHTISRMTTPTLSHSVSCGASITVSVASCNPSASHIYSWSNGDNTATTSSLQPGTYDVEVGDSNIGCSIGLVGNPTLSVTIPNFTFVDTLGNSFAQSGFACSGSPTTILIDFEDRLACSTGDFSGTIDFGDSSNGVLFSSHFTFNAINGEGSFLITHNYPNIGTYSATLTIVSANYAGLPFTLNFDVTVSSVSQITFPPTMSPSNGYEMLIYVPYVWTWDSGLLNSGDTATATLFYPVSGSELLDVSIDLDSLSWEWKMHANNPGEYSVEIRRNSDGCMIGERKYIEITLHN